MKNVKTKGSKKLPFFMIFLSLVGIVISVYLAYTHYMPPEGGSGCDLSENISCSLVNTSVYSEVFGVAVALFGIIWFFLSIPICWKAFSDTKKSVLAFFTWSILGLLSVIYLVIAEIILRSLCPYCTIVHVIVITFFVISLILIKRCNVKITLGGMWQQSKGWIILGGILSILLVILFNVFPEPVQNADAFAQCIASKGIKMYGSYVCSGCLAQIKMLGGHEGSFRFVEYIECHPKGPNPQTDLCLKRNIQKTPTWILEKDNEEIKRLEGFQSFEDLSEFSGCPLNGLS